MSLSELQGALVRMNHNGLRSGLGEEHAVALIRALSAGTPLEAAAEQSGLDTRAIRAVQRAAVADVPAVLTGQLQISAALSTNSQRLRAAGTYPLVLAAAVLMASGTIAGVMIPALSGLSSQRFSPALLLGTTVLCAAMLGLLAAAVHGRVRLPVLNGWPMVHRSAFLESLAQLTAAGATLPAALRASAVWCLPRQHQDAVALAQALEAAAAGSGGELLAPLETAMLVGGAQSGTAAMAAEALAAQDRVRLTRSLPDAILRIHTTALLIAGGAVLAVGIALFSVYGNVLAW